MPDALPSFVRKGKEALEDMQSGAGFISLKNGDMVEVYPLHGVADVISIMQHRVWIDAGNSPIFPCLQTKDCPGCMIGNKPSLRAMMVVKQKGEDDQKIYAFGIQMLRQMAEIEDVIGDIKGAILRLSRKGSSATDTKYNVINTGRRVAEVEEVTVNLLEHLGITTREGIIAALIAANKWPGAGASGPADSSTDKSSGGDPWEEGEFK